MESLSGEAGGLRVWHGVMELLMALPCPPGGGVDVVDGFFCFLERLTGLVAGFPYNSLSLGAGQIKGPLKGQEHLARFFELTKSFVFCCFSVRNKLILIIFGQINN